MLEKYEHLLNLSALQFVGMSIYPILLAGMNLNVLHLANSGTAMTYHPIKGNY
jgi:hypothetical protein